MKTLNKLLKIPEPPPRRLLGVLVENEERWFEYASGKILVIHLDYADGKDLSGLLTLVWRIRPGKKLPELVVKGAKKIKIWDKREYD